MHKGPYQHPKLVHSQVWKPLPICGCIPAYPQLTTPCLLPSLGGLKVTLYDLVRVQFYALFPLEGASHPSPTRARGDRGGVQAQDLNMCLTPMCGSLATGQQH